MPRYTERADRLTLPVIPLHDAVAFPSISTGVYHFPLDRAAKIAIGTIAVYLETHPEIDAARMVCFDARTKEAYDAALAALEAEE